MLNFWRCVLIVAVAGVPGSALAYVGPGAGLSAIGSLLALIAAVLLAIIGFVWYPAKRLWRRRRKQGRAEPAAKSAE
jgi:uncharacterized membrane protein YdjX (TVP38/TMEM64 family)